MHGLMTGGCWMSIGSAATTAVLIAGDAPEATVSGFAGASLILLIALALVTLRVPGRHG
ncbi:MAG: hypothetical protein Fur0039_03560 [Rhodocyclaceae bacterium]